MFMLRVNYFYNDGTPLSSFKGNEQNSLLEGFLKCGYVLGKTGSKWHMTDMWAKYSINNKNHLFV